MVNVYLLLNAPSEALFLGGGNGVRAAEVFFLAQEPILFT
jgi:hypothetical protein